MKLWGWLLIAVVLWIAAMSVVYAAMPVCLKERGSVEFMWKKYRERPVLTAKLDHQDKWIRVYASPQRKTMTVLRIGKDGIVCVMFAASEVKFLYPV